MKIAIIQLSDIHIKSEDDFVCQKIDKFCCSCKDVINECQKVIIAIAGDIAFSGLSHEYDIAYSFLKKCVDIWKQEASPLVSFDYVIVPGNHDCDFRLTKTELYTRNLVVSDVLKNDSIKEEAIEQCLSPQQNFWSFYKKLRPIDDSSKVSWTVEIKPKVDYIIKFNCYNTALLSKLEEKQGMLLIPDNYFIASKNEKEFGVTISLFHHNTGWLSTQTPNNNRKTFEDHLYHSSSVIMCGHEHHNEHLNITPHDDHHAVVYLENPAFQNDRDSGFTLLVLNTEQKNKISKRTYSFDSQMDMYCFISGCEIEINKTPHGLCLSNAWLTKIEELDIPLKHEGRQEIHLSDIYIFPDLEPIRTNDKYYQYVDSENIPNDASLGKVIILEGESQAGKTSLLYTLFWKYYNTLGKYPILIEGKDINSLNLQKIIKSQYTKQYNYNNCTFDSYEQLEKQQRVLLIDDFDNCNLNHDNKQKFIENALLHFNRIIITNGQEYNIKNILFSDKEEDIKLYRLLPLGYEKRDKLIEKWIRLGKDQLTTEEDDLIREVRDTFDQITNLLGQQLIPAFPVFVLSLLQGLNETMNYDVSKTSYAHCYQSLLISALYKTSTNHSKIQGILKFLEEFSYYLYNTDKECSSFTVQQYDTFYHQHANDYNTPLRCDAMLQKLCESNIIRSVDNGCYIFSYKYIFYYLIASKISKLINNGEADKIVEELCNNLHKETEANILIFLVYHNGADKQMEALIFAGMLPFEDYQEITLNTSDPLFADLQVIVDDVKHTVLENVDPKLVRKSTLRNADEKNKILQSHRHLPNEDIEQDKDLKDFINGIKIIKILGQIVKNQKDTLKKEDVIGLIEASYRVCFRALSFFNTILKNDKDDIVNYIVAHYKSTSQIDEMAIRKKAYKLLYMLAYRQCLSLFGILAYSVGTASMETLYNEVANRLGTPAAKIITFTINSYYNRINIRELREIIKEFSNNSVATEIIKARVVNYTYNNRIDYQTKQMICDICKLDNKMPIVTEQMKDKVKRI